MVSIKFSVFLWAFLVLFAQFHFGYSFFLGYKKDLLRHKLYRLKEALLSDHDDYDEIHYIHKPSPVYISSGYEKWPYSSSWPSYGGWSGHH